MLIANANTWKEKLHTAETTPEEIVPVSDCTDFAMKKALIFH